MTLPPVVSNPEVCDVRRADLADLGFDPEQVLGVLGDVLPHIFEPVQTGPGSSSLVCRFCGGGKP